MRILLLLVTGLLASSAAPVFADTIGTTVTGTLTTKTITVDMFPNATATIGNGNEFTYTGSGFSVTVDFTNTGATITINDPGGVDAGILNLTFSDPAFTSVTKISGPLGLASTGPSSFRLNSGGAVTSGSVTILAITSTPEPSSVMLLGTGIVSLAGIGRRRFLASR